MELKLIKQDLFKSKVKTMAHCISSDFALGAGIAVEFQKRFKLKSKLQNQRRNKICDAVLIETNGYKVFNLITKNKYWHKPTLQSLRLTLEDMKKQMLNLSITEIAMPKIGSGLDKLNWDDVEDTLKKVFKDTDINIYVYYL